MSSASYGYECPCCGVRGAWRSRRGWLERFAAVIFLRPFRCRSCYARFWRFSFSG